MTVKIHIEYEIGDRGGQVLQCRAEMETHGKIAAFEYDAEQGKWYPRPLDKEEEDHLRRLFADEINRRAPGSENHPGQ